MNLSPLDSGVTGIIYTARIPKRHRLPSLSLPLCCSPFRARTSWRLYHPNSCSTSSPTLATTEAIPAVLLHSSRSISAPSPSTYDTDPSPYTAHDTSRPSASASHRASPTLAYAESDTSSSQIGHFHRPVPAQVRAHILSKPAHHPRMVETAADS